jgi:hypothetical protein
MKGFLGLSRFKSKSIRGRERGREQAAAAATATTHEFVSATDDDLDVTLNNPRGQMIAI